VICWRLRCTEEPSNHSYHEPNKTIQSSHPISFNYDVQKNPPITHTMNLTKTIQSSHPISFKHWLSHYPPLSTKWFLLFSFC